MPRWTAFLTSMGATDSSKGGCNENATRRRQTKPQNSGVCLMTWQRISLMVLLIASPASAQWAVEEVGPALEQIYITAANAVETAANTAEIVKNTGDGVTQLQKSVGWLESLSANLGSWSMANEYFKELQNLAVLVATADATMTDLNQLQMQWTMLFGLEGVPLTSADYAMRMQEINSYRWQA